MRELRKETRDWDKHMVVLVEQGFYSSKEQMINFIKKYEMIINFSDAHPKIIDNLEKLSMIETKQLEKLSKENKELAVAILETENAKLELKKLKHMEKR